MAITKNKQSQENIACMAKIAFPHKEMVSCVELTEGMCNAAYLLQFSDGSKSVLKIASENKEGFMSNEVNLMDAEVKAMRLVHQSGLVKVASVYYYDTSNTLCDGKYFFMEALEGNSYFSIGEQLTEEEKATINFEVGQIQKKLATICGQTFGLLGDEDKQFNDLFDFVYYLISNVLSDAGKKDIIIGVSAEEILSKLESSREIFDKVKQPTLVHWDMWEGNIFIKEKKISGIIDWERAMWGEAFMDDRFRRHTRNEDFLRGFGQTDFTQEEMCRIYWYDVLLYLTMMTEGAYRGYEDDGQYRWVKPLFEASWNALQKVAEIHRKPIKMIVTDLDGTLLRNDKTISAYTEGVLEELKAQGILFAVATARPIRAVRGMLPFLKYDVGIFHNGAVILDGEEHFASIGVEKPAELIRSILAENPDCPIAVEANDELYANFDAGRIWPGIPYVHTMDFVEMEEAIADKIIIEVKSLDAMAQFQKYLPDDLYLQLSEHTIAMIMNKRATKMNAIRLIAEKYGIAMNEVVAFGDDYNDIDMLKGCGIGVAMNNALTEVKCEADEICDSNEEDGVARWISAY